MNDLYVIVYYIVCRLQGQEKSGPKAAFWFFILQGKSYPGPLFFRQLEQICLRQ
jgi:hypothetical protein